MNIEINGTEYNVPSDVANITLSQFVSWYGSHGKDLDEALGIILETDYPDELLLTFALEDHLLNEAIAWYSHFTGFDFNTIRHLDNAAGLLDQYSMLRTLLKQSEQQAYEFPLKFNYLGEAWEIQDWKVDAASQMTFNEIITSKEVMRQINNLGQNKWDALVYLCAVFLRKENEPFKDDLIFEGSERMKMMANLPLDLALKVAFFLNSCVRIWVSTSQSSLAAEAMTQSLN